MSSTEQFERDLKRVNDVNAEVDCDLLSYLFAYSVWQLSEARNQRLREELRRLQAVVCQEDSESIDRVLEGEA